MPPVIGFRWSIAYHIAYMLCQPIDHCHSSLISSNDWQLLSPFLSSRWCFVSRWVWTDPQTVHSAKKHPIKHLTLIFAYLVYSVQIKPLRNTIVIIWKILRQTLLQRNQFCIAKNIINIKMHLNKDVYKYKTCYLRKSAEQIQGLALPSNMKHLECACGWGSAFLVFSSLNKAKSFAFLPRESKTETSECQNDISGYLLGWLCSSAPLTMILLLQRRREKLQSFRISGLLERQKS